MTARLVALADPAAAVGVPGDEGDLLEGAAVRTQAALAAARTAYVAAHGDPMEPGPPGGGTRALRTRWAVRPRVAAGAAIVLTAMGGIGVGLAQREVSSVLVSAAQEAPGGGVVAALPDDGGQGAGSTDPGQDQAEVGEVVVHVVGEVQAPGVVRLPAGSRVLDAVAAAGGATPAASTAAINLARVLSDGEQVVVPALGDAAAGVAGAVQTRPGAGLVDLNAAELAELDALPGIGPVIAQRILDWRAEHGRFSTVDELAEVVGIGPSLLAGLRDLVRV